MRRPGIAWLALLLAPLGAAAACGGSKGTSSAADAESPVEAGAPDSSSDAAVDAGPQVVVTTLANEQNSPYRLAVGNGSVYWTDRLGGTVASAPIDGGPPADGGARVTLASGLTGNLGGIAVDSNRVYFTDTTGCTATSLVLSVPIAGGAPTTLSSTELNPTAVALDGNNLYWSDYGTGGNGAILSVPVAGGTVATVVPGLTFPQDIAVDATNVYWTTSGQNPLLGMILEAPLAGGTPITLATDQGQPSGIAVDANNVYWGATTGGGVVSVPIAGGSPTTLAMGIPVQVAVDAKNLYWTDEGTTTGTSGVFAVPLAGGAAHAVAGQLNQAVGIAVDATSVYWTDVGEGTVMKATPK